MSPHIRKIFYAISFEAGGVFLSVIVLQFITTAGPASSLTFGIMTSIIAMLWSVCFNTIFEAWEARQTVRGRSKARRVAHAVLFEVTLLSIFLPLTMWWFSVSVFEAFLIEIGLTLAFMVYTYVFTWGFDRVFGLPVSAR
jgi:uncharacterized membrane protein